MMTFSLLLYICVTEKVMRYELFLHFILFLREEEETREKENNLIEFDAPESIGAKTKTKEKWNTVGSLFHVPIMC